MTENEREPQTSRLLERRLVVALYFLWLRFGEIRCIYDNHTITTLNVPTTIQGVGSGWDGFSLLSLVLFCLEVLCDTGRELQGQSMGEVSLWHVVLYKLSTRIHYILVFSTPRNASIGSGMIIWVKSTLELQLRLMYI